MKKITLLFFPFILTLFYFNYEIKPENKEVEMSLNEKIELKFDNILDFVTEINFINQDELYFYNINGKKNGQDLSFYINVSEKDFSFKNLNTKLDYKLFRQYCYLVLDQCSIFQISTNDPICGIYINNECKPI